MERKISTDNADVNAQIDNLSGRPYTIDTRLRLLICAVTYTQNNAWAWLSGEVGVSAEKWRQFSRGSTRASAEMIEAVSNKWPQYAFWLATGISDERHGHHAPHPIFSFPRFSEVLEFAGEQAKPNFPKTNAYFISASKLAKEAWVAGPARETMLSKSHKAAESDPQVNGEYQILKVLWQVKEQIECQ